MGWTAASVSSPDISVSCQSVVNRPLVTKGAAFYTGAASPSKASSKGRRWLEATIRWTKHKFQSWSARYAGQVLRPPQWKKQVSTCQKAYVITWCPCLQGAPGQHETEAKLSSFSCIGHTDSSDESKMKSPSKTGWASDCWGVHSSKSPILISQFSDDRSYLPIKIAFSIPLLPSLIHNSYSVQQLHDVTAVKNEMLVRPHLDWIRHWGENASL